GVLTNALSQNRYAYAHNNPVNYADPSGHSIWDSIKNGVTNAVNAVTNFVGNAFNAAKSAITGTTTKTVANTSSPVKQSYTNTAVRKKASSAISK
ncbi:hypothetical protein JXX08_21155, partial [Ruthenibacterium lactatiformans]|nr:hypothetical protein [Ruthenibacterium lactatiformans]